MIKSKNIYIAAIWPVLANAFIVALELHLALELPYWMSALEVGIGEAAVMVVGLVVFLLIRRSKKTMYFLTLDNKYLEDESSKQLDSISDDKEL